MSRKNLEISVPSPTEYQKSQTATAVTRTAGAYEDPYGRDAPSIVISQFSDGTILK